MESMMLRVLGAGAMLFALASTVAASEHYVETWNPPEARLSKPATQSKPHPGKPALIAHGMPKAAARRVADPLAKTTSGKHASGDASRKRMSPSTTDIPRIITPEGNVLRVSDGGMAISVKR
jgi:hypothetical protein